MMTEFDERLDRHPSKPGAHRPTADREEGRFQEDYRRTAEKGPADQSLARSLMRADDTSLLAQGSEGVIIALNASRHAREEYTREMSRSRQIILRNHVSFKP